MPGVHHKPTQKTKKMVGDLTLHGVSQGEIAKRLGVAIDTLVKHYYYEIYELRHDVNCEIENILLKKARNGDMKAVKLWLTCRAKWAPARTLEEQEKVNAEKSLIERLLDKIPVDERHNDSESTS